MNRAARRRMEREEGKPAAWERRQSPKEAGATAGWFGEMDRAFSNDKYAVLVRTVKTEWGLVEHAAIRNTGSTDIPWREKQRIKNELFGPERIAVEVFPAESDLVDVANMYHIWVLPIRIRLPFGLHKGGTKL